MLTSMAFSEPRRDLAGRPIRIRRTVRTGSPNRATRTYSINLRMKGASIVWTEEHAEGVLHICAHAKSGRWDELEAAVLTHTQ
jgi:hypothetical protein